jgi:hypothetical protein
LVALVPVKSNRFQANRNFYSCLHRVTDSRLLIIYSFYNCKNNLLVNVILYPAAGN